MLMYGPASNQVGADFTRDYTVNREIAGDDLPESFAARYIRCIVNQLKGGDPVSHCPSPRSPAFVLWILASSEVQTA
jgi:hypothetical protein